MTIFQAVILGIVQGLTEFLPISSSGHLVIVPWLFNWQIPTEQIFPFDVLVQMGTLVGVIVFFWQDLIKIAGSFIKGIFNKRPFEEENARLGWMIILATIPAGILGLLLDDVVEAAFQNPVYTGFFLLFTAVLLFLSDRSGNQQRGITGVNWLDAIIIGLFQALAIFPGVSRSGSTISGGLFRNLKRDDAARFSFIMSIPIMLAAGAKSSLDLLDAPGLTEFLPVLLVGFLVSGIVGYFSIRWLLGFLKKNSFVGFAIYCSILGTLIILINYVF